MASHLHLQTNDTPSVDHNDIKKDESTAGNSDKFNFSSYNNFTPTEAIINFVYEDNIYGNDGIIEAAGDAVKQEYEVNRLKDEHNVKKGVVVTGAGNLHSQSIFHVTIFPNPAKFKNALHIALRLADRRGLRSIAVPAMPNDSPAQKALIDQYFEVLYEFEEQANPMCLHSIVIVTKTDKIDKYHDEQMTVRGETLKSL